MMMEITFNFEDFYKKWLHLYSSAFHIITVRVYHHLYCVCLPFSRVLYCHDKSLPYTIMNKVNCLAVTYLPQMYHYIIIILEWQAPLLKVTDTFSDSDDSVTADRAVQVCLHAWQQVDTAEVHMFLYWKCDKVHLTVEKHWQSLDRKTWMRKYFFFLIKYFFQIKPLIFPPLRWGLSCTNLLMFIQDAEAAFPRNEPSKVWLHIIEFHWMDRGVIHQKFIPFNKTFVTICQSHKLRHFPCLQLKRRSD